MRQGPVGRVGAGGWRWRRWGLLAAAELQHWLRSGGFWLALAAMHLWGLPWRWNVPPILTSQDVAWKLLAEGLSFGGLLVLFTSAAAMGRDRGPQAREWIHALPITNAETVAARWLGGLLAWGLAGWELFGAAALAQAASGDAPIEAGVLAAYWAGHFLPGIALLHTLGTVLGALALPPLPTYGLALVLWALTALPMSPVVPYVPAAAAALPAGVPPRGVFLQPSVVAGLYPYEPLVFWRRFVQVSLALLGVVLAALAYHPGREAGALGLVRRRALLLGTAAVLVLAMVLGGRAYGDWQRVIGSAFRDVPASASGDGADGTGEAPGNGAVAAVAEAMTLDVQVDEGRSRYRVLAAGVIRNVGSGPLAAVPIHLGPTCVVEEAAGAGSSLSQTSPAGGDTVRPAVQNGAELVLPAPLAPGESAQFYLRYHCSVRPDRPWRLARGLPPVWEQLEYPAFPAPPDGILWDVTVTVPDGWWLVGNVPQAGQGAGADGRRQVRLRGRAGELNVFGARYVRREHGPLHGFAHPFHVGRLGSLLAAVVQRLEYHRRWLGDPRYRPDLTPRPVVAEVPEPFVLPGVLAVREQQLLNFVPDAGGTDDPGRQRLADSLALALWWGGDPLGSDPLAEPVRVVTGPGGRSRPVFTPVELGVVQFLNVRFHMAQGADPQQVRAAALAIMREAVGRDGRSGPPPHGLERFQLGLDVADPVAGVIFLTLDQVAERLGEDAARRLVQAVHSRFLEAGVAALRAVRRAPAGPKPSLAPALAAEVQARAGYFLQVLESLPGAQSIAAAARQQLAASLPPIAGNAGEEGR